MSHTLSMTGYGRGESEADGLRVAVEIRTVNHRFADVQVKLPRAWMALERGIVSTVKDTIGRGRAEVFARRDASGAAASDVRIDSGLIAAIQAQARALDTDGLDSRLALADLLRLPGVLQVEEATVDAAAEGPVVREALARALESLLTMRATEGAALERVLRGRIDAVGGLTEQIASLAAEQPALFRQRLEKRLADLLEGQEVDEGRLVQEAALLAARSVIAEEITRLRAHVAHGHELLDTEGPVGRKLEFLVQEMGREANTIGSKSDDARLAALVVELKSEIEKIREQVANVE